MKKILFACGILALLQGCGDKQGAEEASFLACRKECDGKGLNMDVHTTETSHQCACQVGTSSHGDL